MCSVLHLLVCAVAARVCSRRVRVQLSRVFAVVAWVQSHRVCVQRMCVQTLCVFAVVARVQFLRDQASLGLALVRLHACKVDVAPYAPATTSSTRLLPSVSGAGRDMGCLLALCHSAGVKVHTLPS